MNFFRWLGVLPLAGVGFMLPLIMTWMAVSILSLTLGRLSFPLFVFFAGVLTLIGNVAAGYAAVVYGARLAPRAHRQTAVFLAALYVIFTISALVVAWRRPAVGTGYFSIVYLVATPAGLWWWWLVLAAGASVLAAVLTAFMLREEAGASEASGRRS